MPEYLSPGVYVEEVSPFARPIAGVSTSTAAFVGIVPDKITMVEENPVFDPTQPPTDEKGANSPTITWTFPYDKKEWQDKKDALNKVAAPDKPLRPANPKDAAAVQAFWKAQGEFALADARLSAGTIEKAGQPVLCTSFTDFKRSFGGFSIDGLGIAPGDDPKPNGLQNQLAHAVFGFFNNGGTRCYVMRYPTLTDLQDPTGLAPFEAIDEISIVAAPGILDKGVQQNIVDHCTNLSDRFAILDGPCPKDPNQLKDFSEKNIKGSTGNTDYGALYFPWIKVFDKPTKLTMQDSDGEIFAPPSGHMAGIYSRVDHERGVHKAPANEVVRGALDLEYQLTKSQQDGLNPVGINCIRYMNNDIRVWGARTIGGDANADLKYINVRRLLLFLRKSIDHGTQWVVFEPNDRTLWAKIRLNVTAFLTTVWRDGALFGSTPQEAFYVKCDDETNPPEERDLGRVTTEIGVAIVRPAEFVIFRISQWAGPQGQQ